MTARPIDVGVPARENAFRSARIERLAYRGATPAEIVARWEALDRSGALVGPHGTGKTTLLSAVVDHLRARGEEVWTTVFREDEDRERTAELGARVRAGVEGVVIVIDGAERIGPLRWRALRRRGRRARGWLITTHAPGRLATVHTHRTPFPVALELVDALAPGSARDPEYAERVRTLHARCEGDVRELLRLLYRERAGAGEPPGGPERATPLAGARCGTLPASRRRQVTSDC